MILGVIFDPLKVMHVPILLSYNVFFCFFRARLHQLMTLKLHQQKILQDVLNKEGPDGKDFANTKEFNNKKEDVSKEAEKKYKN